MVLEGLECEIITNWSLNICATVGAGALHQVVVPLQEGEDRCGDNLGVVEVDMVRSRHRPVLVQRVRAVSLHCSSVQLLGVPLLGVCLDKKMRTADVPAELEEEVRGKTVEGSHLQPPVPRVLPPALHLLSSSLKHDCSTFFGHIVLSMHE